MTSFIQDLKEKRNDQIKKRIHTTIPNFFKRKKILSSKIMFALGTFI